MENKITNRIVITGGSGFIGTSLLIKFKQNNFNDILVIDKHKPQLEWGQYIIGNFEKRELLENAIQKNDIVIHLACSTVPSTSELDKARDINENILSSLMLFDICAKKKINKIIFLSSGGTVYGDHGKKILKETDLTNPINSHGIMKLAIEQYINLFNRLYGLNYIILRAANPYGWPFLLPAQTDANKLFHREKNQGVIDIFLRKAINNETLEIWGDGKIVRDYIHIDDLTNFIITLIKNPIQNKLFNAGAGIGTEINEIVKIIKKITEKKLSVSYLPKRNFDVPHNILDIKKARKLIDWEPRIGIEEGIKMVYKNI
ncbi:MAG: NAD-dependent epimerase/dehydratase family protein [bacterium]